MNLKQLEFAVALAEEGNFTRAAQRCHVVQSALSHQIAHLEDELQATLFERLQVNGERTVAYPMHEPWLDVGRPSDYEMAQRTGAAT